MRFANKIWQEVVAVDVGSSASGVTQVYKDGGLWGTNGLENALVVPLITDILEMNPRTMVLIEDIVPYSGQISPQTIQTCKFIGELEWRLKWAHIEFLTINRSHVRQWVYNKFPDVVIPLVEARIKKKGRVKKDGEPVAPSFIYVDDRVMIAAMRVRWNVPAETGRKNRLGWNNDSHAWQALALATYFIDELAK